MAPGYRPPSEEPRGRWARHIHAYRKANGINATRAHEMWHEGLGLAPKSRTAYLAIDLGKREPTEREAEYLASQIGWPPESPTAPLEATQTPDPLVRAIAAQTAAIRDQTTAITALVAALLGNGTPHRDAAAAVQELADRLLSQRPDVDPVSSGTQ